MEREPELKIEKVVTDGNALYFKVVIDGIPQAAPTYVGFKIRNEFEPNTLFEEPKGAREVPLDERQRTELFYLYMNEETPIVCCVATVEESIEKTLKEKRIYLIR